MAARLWRWFFRPKRGAMFHAVEEALGPAQDYARSHGGRIVLLEVTAEGDVHLQFRGACVGCPLASVTLKIGIEKRLRDAVPGIGRIVVR